RIAGCQARSGLPPDKQRIWVSCLKPRQRGSVADDDFRTRMTVVEKAFDVLLDRDSPNVELDRPRQAREHVGRCKIGTELCQIHASAPVAQTHETLAPQLLANGSGGDHHS